ncbi:hypothetical protein FPV67DRAFT_1429273, partial [Lyophyllum atratum]
QQIKRWMAYQYWKDREDSAKGAEVQDAFLTLLQRLTGKGLPKPRRITASNHWQQSQDSKVLVDAEVTRRLEFSTKPKERAGIRSKVVSDLFKKLPDAERAEWEESSVQLHELALAEWERKTAGPPSTAPEDRQKYIQAITPFMQRILTLVTELTDMKTTFLAGGPEPGDAGRLDVIGVHAGHCPGNVHMNFGVSEREAYKRQILPVFGTFLKKCYTVEHCRAQALPAETVSLANSFEEHAAYATVDSLGSLGAPTLPPLSLLVLDEPAAVLQTHGGPTTPQGVPWDDPTIASTLFSFPDPTTPSPLHMPLLSAQTSTAAQAAGGQFSSQKRLNDDDTDHPSKRAKPATAPLTPRPLITPSAPSSPAPSSPTRPRPRLRPRPRPRARVPAPPVLSASPPPASPPLSSVTTVPPAAPKWFKQALAMFNSDEALGAEWNALVRSWAAFELKENYVGTVKFPCKDRPDFVSGWIKRARAIHYRPIDSSNLGDTETGMTAWRDAVPPAQLACPGINGVLSLLAGLFMWGAALSDAPAAHRAAWVKMLADVHVAF